MSIQRFTPRPPVEPQTFEAIRYDGSNDQQILDFAGDVASSVDHVQTEGSLTLTIYDRFTQKLHTGDWIAKNSLDGVRCYTDAAMTAYYIKVS